MDNQTKGPTLDPVVKAFIDALVAKDGLPIYKLPVASARKVLSDLQAGPIAKLPADIEDRSIPVGPKGSVAIRIVRPKGITQALPVIIYMHGGGWVLGDKETHDRLVREIAHGTQAAVVFVDYSRAPESHYPTAHEEGYAAAKWIAENGQKLNLDTSRIAIAGDSVGGLLATTIAMMAQERRGPKFIFQVLFYPVTDASFDTPSYKQFATGYYLERNGMKWFWDSYVPDKAMREQPLVAPLNASLEQLKKLPPAFVMVNECDVLRDEGEAYAHKLMQAGVPVVGCRYLGLVHDSVMLNPITKAPGVRAAIAQANHLLAQAFAKNNR
jgi:acetyl esterase